MKRLLGVCMLLTCVGMLFTACQSENNDLENNWNPSHGKPSQYEEDEVEEPKAEVDYSEYIFADVTYTREIEGDTEYITMGADGSFSYYCACGNPVNDSDLTETYTYDDKMKTVTLDCDDSKPNMVTEIIIKECTEEKMVLDFDSDIREFVVKKGK